MKSKILAMIMAMGLTFTVGSASAAGELHIYNWGNYTNPEMIEKFEKMHDVRRSFCNSIWHKICAYDCTHVHNLSSICGSNYIIWLTYRRV